MDEQGRLIITKADEIVFEGETFEETGVLDVPEIPKRENRHQRRRREAVLRKLAKESVE